MSVSSKFRVAICGGGIGGLALALALAPYADIAVDVYEAAARFEEIGAGLGIWGRGITALRKLGLEERVRTIATAPLGKHEGIKFELRRADQPSEGETFGHLGMSTNLGFHRAQFLDLLVDMISETGRIKTHFGKRCISFAQGTGVGKVIGQGDLIDVRFGDGTSVTCDVLVGCDGIKSAVRGELIRQAIEVSVNENRAEESLRMYPQTRFSGTVAYRALVKPEDLRAVAGEHSAISGRKMYCGKDRHIVTYPVGGGRFINFIAYSSDPSRQEIWGKGPWVAVASHNELVEQYRQFEPEVQALLKCVGKSSRWAMYDVEPLQFWSRGQVTLLGDAAHATTPFIGAGGGQVLEDAYVLSRLLGSPVSTRGTLSSILLAYEHVRRPRANKVIVKSLEARRAFEFLEEYDGSTNYQVAHALNKVTRWLWEGEGDPDDDVREAERLVREWST